MVMVSFYSEDCLYPPEELPGGYLSVETSEYFEEPSMNFTNVDTLELINQTK